ncbi:polyprenyl synthetase, putative [Coccidioides posadasii C735 delta SOWgp]|uniref:Polyprenyl synthetase, putative n=1 Tax=Coccidioides posadasii (strain C735) TaxID=222929 RepID=C5PCW0_COCP7|nr:polyprenyl synthetase, putative [Coccidioides posadasii C735 delta SOWgp]EER24921.1 polyprenyl synthetase, putative [Coccidioides posadasii C735 delta SOWgp]|eukprot:XP_003067066.1 polyprenyl synthetase, putative [Coccidioides posadasii C735 delta SOWgp]
MAHKYSTIIDSSTYDTQGLCPGIDLRRHVAGDLEEVGAFRAQEDWRRLVGPLEKPYAGLLGPDFSFITAAVPECLPDRMEITAYALEFGFMHDDVIDKEIHNASLDEMEHALEQGGQTGKIDEKAASGKRKIVAQILREMMAIDPERAMTVAKSWAAGVQHSSRRQDETHFNTLEEYIPYRALDVGYMLWHGLVTFGCAITIPEEEADEARELLKPALITASLTNDLFSFEKERGDANVQNAILVVMREHGCSEEEAREICKERIRVECANYVRVVKNTRARTDISDELKRYIEVMQYTLSGNAAWSTNCPRYNGPTKFNELQLLRAEYGLEKYPAMWPPKDATNGLPVETERKEPLVNGNGHYASTKANGLKRKRNGNGTGDDTKKNGIKCVKKSAQISQLSTDSFALADVVSLAVDLNLPELSDDVVLQPYRYLTSLPSKGFRDQAIDSLNTWLKVPQKSAKMIKSIVKMLHSASLMLDDIEDDSPLRRGRPSTHNIYGTAQTINSATYQYVKATGMATELGNPSCLRIFIEEMQQLHVGQSYDLYWTHNTLCPSVSEYLKMVDMKTGGLFRMLTRLMVAESPVREKVSDDALNLLSCLVGRFFQIRDDYQNLASADYAKQKGFAEDLDEGKLSFTLIHCIRTVESEPKFAGDAMQLRASLMKRRLDGKLSIEAKREVLATMKKTKSLDYTLDVLRELHGELEREVGILEAKFGEENFSLRLMLEMLKV